MTLFARISRIRVQCRRQITLRARATSQRLPAGRVILLVFSHHAAYKHLSGQLYDALLYKSYLCMCIYRIYHLNLPSANSARPMPSHSPRDRQARKLERVGEKGMGRGRGEGGRKRKKRSDIRAACIRRKSLRIMRPGHARGASRKRATRNTSTNRFRFRASGSTAVGRVVLRSQRENERSLSRANGEQGRRPALGRLDNPRYGDPACPSN